jgi:hypothetical protein
MARDRGGTPKLLNQPTEARQVKPLSEKPDKRFSSAKSTQSNARPSWGFMESTTAGG